MARELQRFEIVFKDPVAAYKAGDVLSGNLQLDLAQELKLKGIRLDFLGAARVHWDEKRAYTKGSSAKLSHRNVDSYLDETFVIMNKGDTLSAGRYNWPFLLRLPLYLPSSFEGQWGRVQYVAKAVLERPWKGDIESAKTFTVLGLLDLNSEPDARKSIENILEASVGSGCCKTGVITAHLSVEKRGFSIGQTLPFTSNINNDTTQTFNVRIVLSQQATFRADKQVRKSSTVIRVLTKGDVRAREKMTWTDEMKAIPTLPPSRLGGGCKAVDIKYILMLILAPSRRGSDLEIPVELIIGTTPLRRSASSNQPTLTVKAAAAARLSVTALNLIQDDNNKEIDDNS